MSIDFFRVIMADYRFKLLQGCQISSSKQMVQWALRHIGHLDRWSIWWNAFVDTALLAPLLLIIHLHVFLSYVYYCFTESHLLSPMCNIYHYRKRSFLVEFSSLFISAHFSFYTEQPPVFMVGPYAPYNHCTCIVRY